MSAREFFNNNPAIVTGGAVLVLVICLTAIAYNLFGGFGTGSKEVKVMYYDIETNTVILKSGEEARVSPLADNANAYRAFVYACGECGKITEGMSYDELTAGNMFIAYLLTQPELDRMEPGLMTGQDTEIYDFTAENPQWYSTNTAEGAAVQQVGPNWPCEDGSKAKPCQP